MPPFGSCLRIGPRHPPPIVFTFTHQIAESLADGYATLDLLITLYSKRACYSVKFLATRRTGVTSTYIDDHANCRYCESFSVPKVSLKQSGDSFVHLVSVWSLQPRLSSSEHIHHRFCCSRCHHHFVQSNLVEYLAKTSKFQRSSITTLYRSNFCHHYPALCSTVWQLHSSIYYQTGLRSLNVAHAKISKPSSTVISHQTFFSSFPLLLHAHS